MFLREKNSKIIAAAGCSIILIILLLLYHDPIGSISSRIFNPIHSSVNSTDDLYLRGTVNGNSPGKQIPEKIVKYVCGFSLDRRSDFIVEYKIPIACSQPVGIAVDHEGKPWIAATWTGHLLVFSPYLKKFVDVIEIPNWKTNGGFGSMVWGMEFDRNENLWFTDQLNNAIWQYKKAEKKFEMYKIPTRGGYPVQVAFDSVGQVWFSEIFGKRIGVIDPTKVENNTSRGITEYELKNVKFETLGPVTVGRDNRSLWFTAVTFPEGGNIVKFDMNSHEFKVFRLAKGGGVPIGIAEDQFGRLWINDHANNLFFMFNPLDGKVVKYSTSLATSRNTTTTLPYWSAFYNGRIWFNEHEGNSIAYFDTDNFTLVEYQIPSRSSLWGNTSNPLKFALDYRSNGSIWFTEWTENKLGLLDSKLVDKIPLQVTLSVDKVSLSKNQQKAQAVEVTITPKNKNLSGPVEMTVAGSMSVLGKLWNMTGQFSENSFNFLGKNRTGNESELPEPHKVTLWLVPTQDLVSGNYTLTIGARNNGVTYSKMINLEVF